MFSFSYDPKKNLLTIVQRDYWTMAVFANFEREYLDHHERIRRTHDHYRVLADCREYPVQSADVSEAFGRLFVKLMAENRGHCAILTTSTLSKMQAKRAIPQSNVLVFTDMEEAMGWLFADGTIPQ